MSEDVVCWLDFLRLVLVYTVRELSTRLARLIEIGRRQLYCFGQLFGIDSGRRPVDLRSIAAPQELERFVLAQDPRLGLGWCEAV